MGLALEFDAHNLQTIKLGTHIAQAVLIFVSWALEIAVFHNASSIDGRPGWYFGLVCKLFLFAFFPISISSRNSGNGNILIIEWGCSAFCVSQA